MAAKDYVWGVKGVNGIANIFKLMPLKVKRIIKEETERALLEANFDWEYFFNLFCHNKKDIINALEGVDEITYKQFFTNIKNYFPTDSGIIIAGLKIVIGDMTDNKILSWAKSKILPIAVKNLASRCPAIKVDCEKCKKECPEKLSKSALDEKKKTKVSKVGQKRVSKKIGILISKEKMDPKQAAAVAYSVEKRGELKKGKKVGNQQ